MLRSGRPTLRNSPSCLPFSSSCTIGDRVRSGPVAPPRALEPWQKPQRATRSSWPRCTASASNCVSSGRGSLAGAAAGAGRWSAGGGGGGAWAPTLAAASKTIVAHVGYVRRIWPPGVYPPFRRIALILAYRVSRVTPRSRIDRAHLRAKSRVLSFASRPASVTVGYERGGHDEHQAGIWCAIGRGGPSFGRSRIRPGARHQS